MSCSVVSLCDTVGEDHTCQPKSLSKEKLVETYNEARLVVGQIVNSRHMIVDLSPRHWAKLLAFLSTEG
jgi:hypothetical protein